MHKKFLHFLILEKIKIKRDRIMKITIERTY